MAKNWMGQNSYEGPAMGAVAVTASDSVDLDQNAKALWVGVAGDISVEMVGTGTAIVLKNVQGLIPIRVSRVNSTSTTATSIVALY